MSGEPTYARTIERALTEMVQRSRLNQAFTQLVGSGGWSGSLAEMRRDRLVARETRGIYRPPKAPACSLTRAPG